LYLPVTLVVPILNEIESLPDLLQALKAQTHRPSEIIFSDAGSTDGSADLIKAWWNKERWHGAKCSVLSLPGAMPGAGRNAGIRAASNNWIAFIDGGIVPAIDWLEQVSRCAIQKNVSAVFGVCHFSASTPFSKAICALSYGHGSQHAVIPASLFKREVFDTVGEFIPSLRAGEDLIWMASFYSCYGEREVCTNAQVSYVHFPNSWQHAFSKWYITELNCSLAGIKNLHHMIYLLGLPLIYLGVFSGGYYGAIGLLFYLLLRGVYDPFRRSKDSPWWGQQPRAALIAIPMAAMLDLAKWSGILRGVSHRCILNVVRLRRQK
jgi:glycosyltransferase involved in cell wall biosynthesis